MRTIAKFVLLYFFFFYVHGALATFLGQVHAETLDSAERILLEEDPVLAGFDFDANIIGGPVVSPSETVGQVTVALSSGGNRVLCSAVLIAEDAVLTAAHCADARQIIFSTEISSASPKRQIKSTKIHPGYRLGNPRSLDPSEVLPVITNDLAVMKFDGGIPASHKIAKLPGSGSQPTNGKSLTAAGYGRNSSGSVDGRLRKLDFKASLGGSWAPGMIDQYSKFAVPTTPTKAPCFGDSGGPTLNGSTIVGIASHRMVEDRSYACECRLLVYTNVGDYVSWIRANM